LYIHEKLSVFDYRSVRSILRLRFFIVVGCLFVIACIGISLYDDDLTDNYNSPLCILQILPYAVIVNVIALWSTSGHIRWRDAQTALLISRSPPDLLHR